jgi:hypothetical protein
MPPPLTVVISYCPLAPVRTVEQCSFAVALDPLVWAVRSELKQEPELSVERSALLVATQMDPADPQDQRPYPEATCFVGLPTQAASRWLEVPRWSVPVARSM